MTPSILLCLRSSLRVPLFNFSRQFSSISAVEENQSKGNEGTAVSEENASVNIIPEITERKPVILSRQLKYLPKSIQPRAAWVENLDTLEEQKLGIVDLHPEVWGAMPRVDLISHCIRWQKMYKFVDYRWTPTRAEMPGGGRKPWPQKGTGRARHGSVRSPLFKNGGIVHGPRGPTSYFYMLPYHTRVLGLTSTLSVKLAQDDLHVVDSLEIPTEDPQFLEDLVSQRNWGLSVLFVDVPDLMPRNITLACDAIKHMNLMPAYGLNVYSMLKHETLVLTTAAVEHLEEKLLFALHRTDDHKVNAKFKINQQ